MKTNELIGDALDCAVAKCAELPFPFAYDDYGREYPVSPSTLWAQGGPIIERECIGLLPSGNAYFERDGGTFYSYGPTPLIAAMRCYVASKLGDEVELPTELDCI